MCKRCDQIVVLSKQKQVLKKQYDESKDLTELPKLYLEIERIENEINKLVDI
jgi:hypothetical protein